MRNVPMRFDGMSLHHNPRVLKIENIGNISRLVSPCCEPDSLGLGISPRRISGEGELYGSGCLEQYHKLEELHRLQHRGRLLLPQTEPLTAYLSELELKAEPVEDILQYRFVFIEALSGGTSGECAPRYIVPDEDESLWDISYRCQIAIERLVELNPQISMIDALGSDERVRVC